MEIRVTSQHPFRKAQVLFPLRPGGAFLIGVGYYALSTIFSYLIGVHSMPVRLDTAIVAQALLLAISVPSGVNVLNHIDAAFLAITARVPPDRHRDMQRWLREFSALINVQSKGIALAYAVGIVVMSSLAGYLLFLNPYIHQRALDLYSNRGIIRSKASAFLLFDFLTFFLPMSIYFVFGIGIWLTGITWLVLRVKQGGHPYAVGRMWPSSMFWRNALSRIMGPIIGKPWLGGTLPVEVNAYHHDGCGGLRSVIDVHFRAMIIVAINLGLFGAYALQGLPLFDTSVILITIGNIIFITFVLVTFTAHKFLETMKRREYVTLENRMYALRGRLLHWRSTTLRLQRDASEASVIQLLVGEIERVSTWPIGPFRSVLSIVTPLLTFLAERYLAILLHIVP